MVHGHTEKCNASRRGLLRAGAICKQDGWSAPAPTSAPHRARARLHYLNRQTLRELPAAKQPLPFPRPKFLDLCKSAAGRPQVGWVSSWSCHGPFVAQHGQAVLDCALQVGSQNIMQELYGSTRLPAPHASRAAACQPEIQPGCGCCACRAEGSWGEVACVLGGVAKGCGNEMLSHERA